MIKELEKLSNDITQEIQALRGVAPVSNLIRIRDKIEDIINKNGENLLLNNGTIAEFVGLDSFHRQLYSYEFNNKKFIGVYLDRKTMYSKTKDGEPDCPLREELQPKKDIQ